MSILTKYPQKSPQIAARIIDGEAVVITPQAGLARILNETGSRIWQLLDEQKSVQDIINVILREYELPEEEARRDILEFIQELVEKEMIILRNEPSR